MKNKLQMKLNRIIKEEKIKEEQRHKNYEKAKNDIEKKTIEKKKASEREFFNKKLEIMKKENEKILQQYETKLKSE